MSGAFALREVLDQFEGGRVLVGVTSTPFRCPPAPSETTLLVNDFLSDRGLRERSEVSLVMPFPVPIPPSPLASEVILAAFEERGITWHPNSLVRALDPDRKVAVLGDGGELPYDLFLDVPVHRAPAVSSPRVGGERLDPCGSADPPDQLPGGVRDRRRHQRRDPEGGVFAEGQSTVVAAAITASVRNAETDRTYDGHGICYMEFGGREIAKIDVTFQSGARPVGSLEGPDVAIAADKSAFGSERIQRWFGRAWSSIEA